eukprot:2084057-Alexandrium_andersonii.AAC.1
MSPAPVREVAELHSSAMAADCPLCNRAHPVSSQCNPGACTRPTPANASRHARKSMACISVRPRTLAFAS